MIYYVTSGETSNKIYLGKNDYMYVSKGGTANNTRIGSGAFMYVSNGGLANGTVVNSSGWVHVSKGGTVIDNTINNCGAMFISGSALRTTVSSGGTVGIYGAAVTSTTVSSGGTMRMQSGTATDTVVSSGGSMDIQGGTATSITICSNGRLIISSGVTATAVTPEYGGIMDLTVAPGTYVQGTCAGSDFLLENSVLSGYTVNNGGSLDIAEHTTANGVTVNKGSMNVFSGGTALNIVENGGNVIFDDAAVVTFLPNDFSGVVLDDSDSATVHSGTTAINTTVNSNGVLYVSNGGIANGTTVNSDGMLDVSGGTVNSTTLNLNGYLGISGGTVNDTTINGGGMGVSGGATANRTTINGGGMTVFESDEANIVTVNQDGTLYVCNGGTALNVTENGGYVEVEDGAVVTFLQNSFSGVVLANYASAAVHSGTTAINTTVDSDGLLSVSSGGIADNTTVNDGGHMSVNSDGTATSVTVNANANLTVSGGTANNVTVDVNGFVDVWDGRIAGPLNIAYGGTVEIYGQSFVDFDISGQMPGSPALINDLTRLTFYDPADYLITVSAEQSVGMYTLAGGASSFTGTLSLGTSDSHYGAITVNGDALVYGDFTFTLATSGSNLTLTVEFPPPTMISVAADITAMTNQNVTVSAVFSDNTFYGQYSFDNANWNVYTGGVVMEDNGTVWFRAVNPGGISDVLSYTVGNIDKIPPVKPAANADITAVTNQNVTVTAVFSEDSVQRQYSFDNANWNDYTSGIVFSENGTVFFRGIDAVGNVSEVASYTVGNIDKIPPVKPAANADITTPTNQNVTVTAIFSEDSVQRQYSFDNANWNDYTSGIVFGENGTVYFRGIDALGNVSEVASYTVGNIDKIPPVKPAANADITTPTSQNVTVTAIFSEDSVQRQYSFDNANWNDYTSGIVFGENGTVYFRGIDAAGNVSEAASYTVGNIQNGNYEFTGNTGSPLPVNLNASGKYSITGSFGDITGSVTVLNGGKKAGTGTLKDGVLTFNKGNSILLDSSLPIEVQVTVKKGTDTNYTLNMNAETVFPSYDPAGSDQGSALGLGTVSAPGQQLVSDGWVGYGDPLDFYVFSLDHAANLSLDYTANDTAKFTLFNAATGKSMLSSTLKGGKLTTKAKLLDAGNYYLMVQSTTAKKGGSADYTVAVNGSTKFFTKGDPSDNTMGTAKDLGTVSAAGPLASDWVGFGDTVDFKKITLNTSAKLSFTVHSTDAVKFTVYDAGGKSVGKTTVKAGAPVTAKDILVTAGSYYLAVESTTAKKGGYADYEVTLNGNTRFFPAGDPSNNTWQAASGQPAKLAGEEITGWVGFGDPADFIKFQVAGEGQIVLSLDDATEAALERKEIKLSCLDASGKAVALTAVDDDILVSKKAVSAGEYYLGVTCANVKKFDTSYSITTGLLAV